MSSETPIGGCRPGRGAERPRAASGEHGEDRETDDDRHEAEHSRDPGCRR